MREVSIIQSKQAYPRPRNGAGLSYFSLAIGLSTLASLLANAGIFGWLLAQIIFTFAFLLWFVLLHEAGHQTLFSHRALNRIAGSIAGFFSLIPFQAWRLIHARHHHWTGWQDLDATTATLVPRRLSAWERYAVRAAWRSWFPLFSLIYRVNNFWHLLRIKRYVATTNFHRIVLSAALLLSAYALLVISVGFTELLKLCGVGLFLSWVIEDPLLLSQHTHIPQNLSQNRTVKPFPPLAQGIFTRSLNFPRWFSKFILNFNAHELHHMHVSVPGYDLHRLATPVQNQVNWWTWLRAAKKLPGDVFLFENRNQTGFTL